ncbi:hypothetical protein LguiA_035159 [Lonicera macranthoides]
MDEINERIKTLPYQIQHRSNSLAAEKKLLRDIKQAKVERENITVDVSPKSNLWGYWGLKNTVGSKEAMKDQIKLISNDLDKLKQEKQAFNANLKCHKDRIELKTAESDIARLQRELENINRKKDEVYKYILQLKTQSDEVVLQDENYRNYLPVLNNARELEKKNDFAGLKHLSKTQVEMYMSQWSNSTSFREDYEMRMYHY